MQQTLSQVAVMFSSNPLYASKLLAAAVLATGMIALSGNIAFAANEKEATDPAYKNAVALYQKADYAGAQTEFEKLTNSKTVGETSKYYRALCLQNQKQYGPAKTQYMALYKSSTDKEVRYKAWEALRALPGLMGSKPVSTKVASAAKSASKEGPGSDVWITPKEGYGRSGPAASSEVNVTIIPTSCGRRHR